jgi:hypothetical protein
MDMAAEKAKSENIEKTSMDHWMNQVRCFGPCHLGNTDYRGALPMPFVASRRSEVARASRRAASASGPTLP